MRASMRFLLALSLIVFAFAGTEVSFAAQAKKASVKTASKKTSVKKSKRRAKNIDSLANEIAGVKSPDSPSAKGSEKLSRDIVFDGSSINGRYQSAGAALAVVEAEKNMNELIGFRRDFKDRLAVERERLKSGASVNAGQDQGL